MKIDYNDKKVLVILEQEIQREYSSLKVPE